MLAALPYAIGLVLPAVVWLSAQAGGTWTWLTVAVLYVAFPVADALASLNPLRPNDDDVRHLEHNPWFRAVMWVWVPLHAALVGWAVWWTVTHDVSPWAWTGLLLSVGTVGGAIGITFAHELIHRSGGFERALGDAVLALVSYPHFAVEHVHGHHRHVATPLDPATARAGESFYRFWPRTVFGGLRHAWMVRPGTMVRYAVTTAGLYAVVGWTCGREGVLFFALQGIVAFTLLEAINYVEHYGLQRRETASGRHERVGPQHSWDSSHRVSNWLLINLARHADHHLIASRRYQALASREQAPQLPAGYGTMLLVAFVPPLWRRLMDHRLPRA